MNVRISWELVRRGEPVPEQNTWTHSTAFRARAAVHQGFDDYLKRIEPSSTPSHTWDIHVHAAEHGSTTSWVIEITENVSVFKITGEARVADQELSNQLSMLLRRHRRFRNYTYQGDGVYR